MSLRNVSAATVVHTFVARVNRCAASTYVVQLNVRAEFARLLARLTVALQQPIGGAVPENACECCAHA